MVDKKKNAAILVLVLAAFLIMIVPFVSAGFFDIFKKITGQASSQPTNVSVTVSNVPTIPQVIISSTQSISEGTVNNLEFFLIAEDTDGWGDLNFSTVVANFSHSTKTLVRENSSCVLVGNIGANQANISCTIPMWYFYSAGNYNVTVYIQDNATNVATNGSVSFNLQETPSVKLSPNIITFPGIAAGASNVQASLNTTLNNTGNRNVTYPTANITVTGINLIGAEDTNYMIYAANFSTAISAGGSCAGNALSNNTAVDVTNANLYIGNLSEGSGTAQEELFYCLTNAASDLISQTYSTQNSSSWTISVA